MVSLADVLRERSRSRSSSCTNMRRAAPPSAEHEAAVDHTGQAGGSSGSTTTPTDASATKEPCANAASDHSVYPGKVIAESNPRLVPGDQVMLVGLKAKPELNGKFAKILTAPRGTNGYERCLIEVAGSAEQLSVKLDNLQRSTSTPPAESPADSGMAAADVKQEGAPASGSGGKLFQANLRKLREKVVDEARQPAGPKGRSNSDGKFAHQRSHQEDNPDAVLQEPVMFVPAEAGPSHPSRKCQVIDPRGHGVGELSDSEDDVVPGRIQRPLRSDPLSEMIDSPMSFLHEAAADVGALGAPPTRPLVPDVQGNFSLSVSSAAKEQERVVSHNATVHSSVDDRKKVMLANLTQQLQLCIRRIQDPSLDERAKEKYQDMIDALKAQMAKVTGIQ